MEEVKKEDITKKETDYLIIPLKKAINFEQITIKQLDLTKLKEMTLDELSDIYDMHAALGGSEGVMQEYSIKFAKLLAHYATGYPLEAIGKISARDAAILKARIYRFFYL